MLTTLDIAEDVLIAVHELAHREGKSAGEVLSELARRGLKRAPTPGDDTPGEATVEVLGFRPFPSRAGVVTDELVNRLRETGIE